MTTPPPAGPRALPNPALRFAPELEAEYLRTRLLNDRLLIRMACMLALVITALRAAEFLLSGISRQFTLAWFAPLIPLAALSAAVALTWLAWSRFFVRWYRGVASVVVPLRNAVAAIALTAMAAGGQLELLMVLPVMVLSPFFFLGLSHRAAMVCVLSTIVVFVASAIAFGLPVPVLLRSCGLLVATAATSAVAAWQLERQSRKSFLESRLVAQLAEHDALTGAKNRRVFDEHLPRLWQQAIEDQRPLAIVLIDVDHFKAYNDRYGHQAGDAALRRIARSVQSFVSRPLDVLARYGGEEFAAILYDIDGAQAREIAERMRLAVSGMAIEHRGSRTGRVVTISAGVAAVDPSPGRKPSGALQLADEALYEAKVGGRNKVHLAGESDYSHLQTGVFSNLSAGGG
jgi:diguanylate cyclase (GGDEF)-like protein